MEKTSSCYNCNQSENWSNECLDKGKQCYNCQQWVHASLNCRAEVGQSGNANFRGGPGTYVKGGYNNRGWGKISSRRGFGAPRRGTNNPRYRNASGVEDEGFSLGGMRSYSCSKKWKIGDFKDWLIDFGAAHHVCGDKDLFVEMRPLAQLKNMECANG